jgi:hypothetical protein
MERRKSNSGKANVYRVSKVAILNKMIRETFT